MPRTALCLFFLTLASSNLQAQPAAIDLTNAVVLAPARATSPEIKAVRMLIEEVEKRSRVRLSLATALPVGQPVIAVGRVEQLREMLPGTEVADAGAAEGFKIATSTKDGQPLIVVAGNDDRGVLFGVGRLLRELRLHRDRVELPAGFSITSAPRTKLRGHQIGYRPKTNSYDGWTVAMWEQYIRDLVAFGCNAVELIPPRSDDAADSPHFPLPPLRMMVEVSRLAGEYGIDVWAWYPALDLDYTNPSTVEFALKEWGAVIKALPRLDAIFVPGGDPGNTPPKALFNLLEKQAANARQYHPNCRLWVSPQGFSKERTDEFVALLREEPNWLAGVVHGPQVRLSLEALRQAVPARYPIRDYPDITHSRHCQYPVPDWDVAFALTEGREGSNPRPTQMASIFRVSRPHTVGFLTYSEGCHDDVNKCVWSALGWDERTEVRDILREYARYFIGPSYEEPFADGLLALEKNWVGSALKNKGIDETLAQFRAMEKSAAPAVKLNWRFQQALYRAYYDAYLRARLIHETETENAVLAKLREAKSLGAAKALDEAEALLDRAAKERAAPELRARVFELAEALFQSIRAQLSVERYRAIGAERGANLDAIDTPLSEAGWLKARIAAIRKLPEAERLAAIDAVLYRTDPGPGGFYDDLGDPERQPHLVRTPGWEKDPAFYSSSLTGFGFRAGGPDRSVPKAWWTHAESLFDTPLKLRYTGLDKAAAYRVRVVYGRERLGNQIRLTANDRVEIHAGISKAFEPLEFDIPPEATANGELTLTWTQASGSGGTGRGCQVAEVFLVRKK